jgi:Ser/Thr protein kinase RdoA (MazF antagonist)
MNPPSEPPDDGSPEEAAEEGLPRDGGVLSGRLEQLRDEGWVQRVLASALAQMIPAGPGLSGHDIEYCKLVPDRDVTFVARVLLGSQGSDMSSHLLACTFFSTPEQYQLTLEDRRRLAAEGIPRPVARLDELSMIARVFPVDPGLAGLAPATDPAEMLPVFARHLEACVRDGLVPANFRYEILHYKPRFSCTLRYRIDLHGPGGASAGELNVFGKVGRNDRGVHKLAMLEAAWRASLAAGEEWRAARPVAYLPQWKLLLQEAVPGRDFRAVFAELTPEGITPEQFRLAARHLERIARALRSLQASLLVPRRARTFADLHEKERLGVPHLGRAEPALAAELDAVFAELARLAPEIPASAPVFCHGDFAHGNMLVDGERVGIIDFDKASAAEPAYDIATFLTHLRSIGLCHPGREPHVTALGEHMRACYLALAPEVSAERLALYEALGLASHVLRNFPKQGHQASWLAWGRGQVAAARERLETAAGKRAPS